MSEAQERVQIVQEALSWLRTPYLHNARVKGHGVDCGQFLVAVFEACGLASGVQLGRYTPDWYLHRDDSRYLKWVEKYTTKISDPEKALPGDVALFNFGRCIGHGGIVVDWPLIIHSYVPVRQVTLDDVTANARLKERLAGVWRFNGWR